MKAPDAPDYVVGVVGCGAMGQGIAQVSVQGGIRTLLFDAREGGADAGKAAIVGRLSRLVERGRLSPAEADGAAGLLEPVDGIAGLAAADCVIEAVFEDLDVKQGLFRELERVVGRECVLASNTSSIPLSSIGRVCEHRDRVAGLHFFNPVPLMKLVEVIRATESSDATVSSLTALGRRMTRTPVEVKDSPGFLVNMGGRAYTTEALRIAHEGIARPEQIDAIMRDCWGFRMGPFELMDLTGIDVNYPVSQIIYEGYNQDPRLKTSPNHKAMFDAGLFGRKTGQGWFAYESGQPLDRPSPDYETDVAPATRVALVSGDLTLDAEAMGGPEAGADAGGRIDALRSFCAEIGLEVVEDDGTCPVLAAPLGKDATSCVGENPKAHHRRLVCIDLMGNASGRVTIMTCPDPDIAILNSVAAAISASGRRVTLIKDSPGFVGQRIVAMIANLGCYMAEIGLATPADIDTAMQLGLNYPRGSIALGEDIEAATLFQILSEIRLATEDDRYRSTQWLRRRAALGLSLYTPN